MKVGDLVQVKISDDIYKPNWLEDKIGILMERAQTPSRTIEEIVTADKNIGARQKEISEPSWHVVIGDNSYIIADSDLKVINESR